MRRRVRNNGFCYNCRCIAALLSRAGRSLGRRRPANIRLSPGVPRRLRPNPRQTFFVILSVSEGSIWGKVTDSSSIFRSPQNDNAVFALNHFRSGTHSSACPGRLRGSRLWARAGPGARSSVSEREQSLRDMLAIIVILSVSEESMMNAASAETACGLYLARRRKTNEVQSNICILTIQILRRSAPQNDKLLNYSQTPQQTGINNWRQRRKVKGKDVRNGRDLQS